MDLPGDDRAAVIQVGAVLIFGILVITLAIYQSQVVPNQNREVEFDHHQTVEGRMVDLRNALLTSAVANAGRPAAVPLGTRYPTRLLAINPPQPAGRLATEPLGNISLANARATDTEADDYLNGTTLNFSTSALVYTPDYNELGSPPSFVYENTLLYSNQTGGAGFVRGLTGQQVIEGTTITLVALDGDLDEAGARSVTVDPEVLSGGYRTVQVTNDAADPVNVTIPTRVPAEEWAERIDSPRVRNVTPNGSARVDIVLDPGTYTLRMAKLGVGSGTVDPGPEYIVPVGSSRTSIAEGTTTELTFEVRDEYNNPVTDASVNVTANSSIQGLLRGPDGTPVDQTLQTDEDGRIVLSYEAPDIDGAPLNLTVGANITGTPKVASDRGFAGVSVTVRNSDGSGTGAGGGGVTNPPGELAYTSAGFDGGGNNNPRITVEFTNNGGSSLTVTEARLNFVFVGSGGGDPTEAVVRACDTTDTPTLDVAGAYESFNTTFPAGVTESIRLDFDAGLKEDKNFFILTLRFEGGATREYIISPSGDLDYVCSGTGGGASLGTNEVAFDDADGNGQFDSGETTYTVTDLQNDQVDDTVDLVIAKDVSTTKVSVTPESVTVQSGVTVETTNGALKLNPSGTVRIAGTLTQSSENAITLKGGSVDLTDAQITGDSSITVESTSTDVDLTGTVIDTTSGGGQSLSVTAERDLIADSADLSSTASMTLKAESGNLDLGTGATLSTASGSGSISATASSGTLTGSGVSVDSEGKVTLKGTSVELTGSTVDVQQGGAGFGQINVEGTSAQATLTDSEFLADSGSVSLKSVGPMSAQGVTVETESSITVSGGSVDLTDGTLDTYRGGDGNGGISITSNNGDTTLERTIVQSQSTSSKTATVSNGELNVADAEVLGGTSGGDLNNANSVTVNGCPVSGRVTPRSGSPCSGGESTNSPPSVTITDISTTDSGMGSSGNLDTATVTFEATDPDQNLENATVVLYIDDEERGRKTEINLTDREGDSVTEEIQPTSGGGDTKGEVEIKVIVYDDAGDTGDTRRSEEDF